jgi:hypothetical protein
VILFVSPIAFGLLETNRINSFDLFDWHFGHITVFLPLRSDCEAVFFLHARSVRSTPRTASMLNAQCNFLLSLSVRITKPNWERAGFAIISFIGVSRICSTHTVGFAAAY